MPMLIAQAILTFIITAGYTAPLNLAFIGSFAYSATLFALSTVISVGISIGLNYAVSAIFGQGKQRQPPPSDRQFLTKTPIGWRTRCYGRVSVAGQQIMMAERDGKLYRVAAIAGHEIDAVEGHVIDDRAVSIDGSGNVTTARYVVGGRSRIKISLRYGTTTQTVYSDLSAAVTEWDSSHIGKGIAHSLIVMEQVAASDFSQVYPAGENTSYRMIIRGAKICQLADGEDPALPVTWTWGDDAASVIFDYLRHSTGFAWPDEWLLPEIAEWRAQAAICREQVSLAAGGSEDRYRISDVVVANEARKDVLTRYLTACDGRLVPGPNGGMVLEVGAWTQPAVTIDDSMILSVSDLFAGVEATNAVDWIRARYTSPTHKYVEVDADPWSVNDVPLAQGRAADLGLECVPSHGQARRLMKRAAARMTPEWTGKITCNLKALQAYNQRFVRLVISEMGINETVEIDNPRLLIEQGEAMPGVVRGIQFDFFSMDATAFEWTAATDEGTAPEIPPDIEAETSIPAPANFGVTVESRAAGASAYKVAVIEWDDLSQDWLTVEVEMRASGGDWQKIAAVAAASPSRWETGALADGTTYEFRARSLGITGRASSYTATVTRSVVYDPTAPAVPVLGTITGGPGQIDVAVTQPNSANAVAVRIYTGTTTTFADATLRATLYGGPNSALTTTITGLSPGSYRVFATSINGSAIASADVMSAAITVS